MQQREYQGAVNCTCLKNRINQPSWGRTAHHSRGMMGHPRGSVGQRGAVSQGSRSKLPYRVRLATGILHQSDIAPTSISHTESSVGHLFIYQPHK